MHWYNTPLRKRIEALERRLSPEPPPKIRVIWPDGGEVWEVNNDAAVERPVARPAGLPAPDSSRGRAETSQETPKPTPPEPPKTERLAAHSSQITDNSDPVLAPPKTRSPRKPGPKTTPTPPKIA